ncbi:hypothetical protein [Mangrovicoccus sp. HB161399]|uniref:hypothetical protein n=1 Tax=Mangrovicoccus sp. HB161399 TaxID=2720392 RepID=UPI001C12F620|nr:hypothetical protein [Mangrovicoccus sp. HB161399]
MIRALRSALMVLVLAAKLAALAVAIPALQAAAAHAMDAATGAQAAADMHHPGGGTAAAQPCHAGDATGTGAALCCAPLALPCSGAAGGTLRQIRYARPGIERLASPGLSGPDHPPKA